MRQDKFSKAHLTLYACGIIPVVWLALLLAPYMDGGLVGLVQYGGAALEHPFCMICIITYTLVSETGASLRAAGFAFDGIAGGQTWTGRRRRDYYVAPTERKHRWIKRRAGVRA